MKQVRTKEIRKRSRKSQIQTAKLPFTKANYQLFVIGLAVILLGFIALAQPPADSFMSITVAPILLIIGYLIIMPAAILYRKKESGLPQNGNLNGR